MKTTCIIIDDEPNAVLLLESYIHKTLSLDLKGVFYDAIDALAFLKEKNTVDLIFTDIDMPLLSGIDLAELLPRSQKFIFTTAYSEHAFKSFSYHVIDYLLKPITFKRFQQSIAKLQPSISDKSGVEKKDSDFIFIKSGRQHVKIGFDDILYICGAKEYISLQLRDKKLLIYKRMKAMEAILPKNFIRIHHSYIVNFNFISKHSSHSITIQNENFPISESYKENVNLYFKSKQVK